MWSLLLPPPNAHLSSSSDKSWAPNTVSEAWGSNYSSGGKLITLYHFHDTAGNNLSFVEVDTTSGEWVEGEAMKINSNLLIFYKESCFCLYFFSLLC